MSSPPDVVEPVPMQVEERYDEQPKPRAKPKVEVEQSKEKIEIKISRQSASEEEQKALENAKTVSEQATNPNVRKDAKQTLDKAKRNR